MWELVAVVVCAAGGLALAMRHAPLWIWALALLAVTLAWQTSLVQGHVEVLSLGLLGLLAWLPTLIVGALSFPRCAAES